MEQWECVLVGGMTFLVAVVPRTNSFVSAGQLTVIGYLRESH